MPIKISKMLPDFLGGNIRKQNGNYLRPTIDSFLNISWEVYNSDNQLLDTLPDDDGDIIFKKRIDVI